MVGILVPDARGWAMLIGLGLFGGGGHFMVIQVLRRAQASVLAPFGYLQLVWATALGYLVFGDFPDAFTNFGTLIVVGSGVYVVYRESVVKRTTRSGRSGAVLVFQEHREDGT